MSLPYRWHPHGVSMRYLTDTPPPGTLVAGDHAVWRIISVTDRPEVDWTQRDREAVAGDPRIVPQVVILRPVALDPSVTAHDEDRHVSAWPPRTWWAVYDTEHYPICAACLEPLPCRQQMAEQVAAAAAGRMERYSYAGICPACQEPVTARQRSLTLGDNLHLPGGPPVTFHLRRRCWGSAVEYEKAWVAADPGRRTTTLSCAGTVTNHNDGTYECTEWPDCPGPRAWHRCYMTCRCPDCHARGSFGCHPPADAVHVDRRLGGGSS
jgi:hypothetical protein